MKDEDGDLPLHLALEMKSSDSVVLEILGASRKDATTFMSRSSRGYLPLHAAMHNVFSDNVLISILKSFPEAAKVKNPTGDLPLYACIEMKRSDKVILAALDANMGATKESSTKGELPLHAAIKNKYADEVIINLMSAYPCAASTIKKDLRFIAADELVFDGKKYRIVEAKSNSGIFEDSFVPNDVFKVDAADITGFHQTVHLKSKYSQLY